VEDFSNGEYDDLVSYHNYKEKSSFKEKGKKEKQKVKKNKRDLFWNCGGLGDPKKFKFSSACLQRKAKTSLTYQKHEVDISLHSFSKHPVVERIFCGMSNLKPPGEDLPACY